MTFKLVFAGIIALVAAGAGWYIVHLIQENERLVINNSTLEQARKDDARFIEELNADILEKQEQVLRREERVKTLTASLKRAKSEVRVITETVVTEVERECLRQPVPVAVVEFMLDDRPINPHEGISEAVSSNHFVHGYARAGMDRRNL